MNELRVIIADDDLSSRLLLVHLMKDLPELKVVGEAENGIDFFHLVIEEKPDIVLVDIHMPGLNGLEAVIACKEVLPDLQIIFITGYDEYAIEAFQISATDYIVKPVERVRLYMALERAKKQYQLKKMSQKIKNLKETNKLLIRSNRSLQYVVPMDILFIEKEGRKTVVHTANQEIETSEPIQKLGERLPSYFVKTHRSYLINLKTIEKIEPSGETYTASFFHTQKVAYISKLKINEVTRLLSS
ncbi:LytR/AlgR family response regulator transcription factor [Neobacillus thermocopriae]|uniref:Response regulator transcription factor n=1 Tax=Neobacillus thermocopriae TaxID=1215031 RepID=A0A6B3TTL9_9BACI|nr:LytTR family DNA-binding domain-containing protein [Neobacillus thermocopriae]MED3625247.1 LytTR family DNA-binding domain-containing protein [Neobacillus thermocopriae]MED3715698.1 LytTR family DNA-binding domain-containing protein [Neobacillus thermocopriae]NEX79656.1 response regulator transcription factor [Neobacillus thermocopriae]